MTDDLILAARSDVTADALADKAEQVFGRLVIDKRRLGSSELRKLGVPAYVGEWLVDSLAPNRGPLSVAEAAKVRDWSQKYIPGPADQQIVKHRLLRGEEVKLLMPLSVEVDLRKGERNGVLPLVGITDAHVPPEIVDHYPDLLRQGMWGVVTLAQGAKTVNVNGFKPMQATMRLDLYADARRAFSLQEWMALMVLSMGYNPAAYSREQQLLLLCRLLPLVQKNQHLVELAPKATGKSYLFENISPKVRLVSGGNVSPAVLFVNNASGQWGILARFAAVVLDEVQTLRFSQPEEIIGALKGFLANGKLTRGGLHETSSDCSLVLLANILLDEEQRPINHQNLLVELPPFLQETAFVDRLKGIIPGWELPKLTPDCFANSVGLKADFFGDALIALRDDLSLDQQAARRIAFGGAKPYRRNQEAIVSNAAGLLKILFPHGEATDEEFAAYCLAPALRLRQQVWDHLYRTDAEFRQWDETLDCEVRPAT